MSFRLLNLVGTERFEIAVSVPLVLEYESVAKRMCRDGGLTERHIDDVIDYICLVAHKQRVFYLWRPLLRDPGDDMVLELAVASESSAIVTFNTKDFAGSEAFGVTAMTPRLFLNHLGGAH